MDRKPLQNPEILRILARSAAARSTLQSEVGNLKQRLNVVGRMRNSLKAKPSSWILGSTAAGLAVGFLFPRFRRTKPHHTMPAKSKSLRLLGIAWTAAQPLAKVWLANQVRSWLAHRAMPPSHPSSSPHNHSR